MHTCPCCSEPLLRHARHSTIYWFCPVCRQEMPVLEVTEFPVEARNSSTARSPLATAATTSDGLKSNV